MNDLIWLYYELTLLFAGREKFRDSATRCIYICTGNIARLGATASPGIWALHVTSIQP